MVGLQCTSVKQAGASLALDQEFSKSQLLSVATWNIQGKSVSEAMVVLEDCMCDFNIASFQEVSGCNNMVHKGAHCFGGEVGPGMSCLYAWPDDCFRPLAVVFDASIGWESICGAFSHFNAA